MRHKPVATGREILMFTRSLGFFEEQKHATKQTYIPPPDGRHSERIVGGSWFLWSMRREGAAEALEREPAARPEGLPPATGRQDLEV